MRFNIPTFLTLGRVAVIPLVLILFYMQWPPARHCAALLFVAASVTDWLDGWLARRLNQTSRFGASSTRWRTSCWWRWPWSCWCATKPAASCLRWPPSSSAARSPSPRCANGWPRSASAAAPPSAGVGKFKTGFQLTAISLLLWDTPLPTPFGEVPIHDIGFVLLLAAAALTLWSMAGYLKAAWPALNSEG